VAGGACGEKRPNGCHRAALPADDLPYFAFAKLELKDHFPRVINARQNHLIGIFDETANNVSQKFFHGLENESLTGCAQKAMGDAHRLRLAVLVRGWCDAFP